MSRNWARNLSNVLVSLNWQFPRVENCHTGTFLISFVMIPHTSAKSFGFHFYSITCLEASDCVCVCTHIAQGVDIDHFDMSCLQRQCKASIAAAGL